MNALDPVLLFNIYPYAYNDNYNCYDNYDIMMGNHPTNKGYKNISPKRVDKRRKRKRLAKLSRIRNRS